MYTYTTRVRCVYLYTRINIDTYTQVCGRVSVRGNSTVLHYLAYYGDLSLQRTTLQTTPDRVKSLLATLGSDRTGTSLTREDEVPQESSDYSFRS